MKKRLLPILLLAALPGTLLAQEETPVSKREPFVPQHELRLTVGAFPILPYTDPWGYSEAMFPAFSPKRLYYGPRYTDGAWSLSYDYRIKKWFDAGLTLSYYGEYGSSFRWSYRDEAWSYVGRNYDFCLTVMPLVRFTWVNRKWVRMYSTLGLGVSFEFGHDALDAMRFRETLVAFQFTPIGIAVGRSLFGFAEVGIGAQGCLMMGVGYKFKPKNKQTK
ncbi:MAG: hypothetical protein NC209_05520 [Alistipes sp.]|nr:hypothetical protein [Alistipes senegalensis]MCM1250584.1 hypothetical protein [Alistipes sp.]